ncbi:MAG: hypothetical protein AAGD13_06165 [Pseudomonadota bacterium]
MSEITMHTGFKIRSIAAFLLAGSLAIGLCAPNVGAQVLRGNAEADCRVERLAFAKASCLEHVFAQRDLLMTQQIDQTLSRLQAATAAELREISALYSSAQSVWRDEVDDLCQQDNPGDPVGVEYCRLSAQNTRQAELDISLARAAFELGAPGRYDVDIPDSVEVLVPLPEGFLFGVETRLPLQFSIGTN